jgi:hypothetical protein
MGKHSAVSNRRVNTTVAAALVATPLALALAAPASADTSTTVSCSPCATPKQAVNLGGGPVFTWLPTWEDLTKNAPWEQLTKNNPWEQLTKNAPWEKSIAQVQKDINSTVTNAVKHLLGQKKK